MFDYDVIYSKRRTIALSIQRDGKPLLRAPIGTKMAQLEAIIKKHHRWIEKHQENAIKLAQAEKNLTKEKIAELKKLA